MTSLHHFQRYSAPENVATNNTLQLISRIYSFSPIKAKQFLTKLLEIEVNIGLDIYQQSRAKSSVPDGIIAQRPFRIVIESKMGSSLGVGQLVRHCDAFGEHEQGILVALTKTQISSVDKVKITEAISARRKDVTFCTVTYEDVCDVALENVQDFEYELKELVLDYQSFCYEFGLIPVEHRIMRVVPTGNSFDINMQYGVYYDPAHRGYSPHKFIGLYKEKSIRGIMEVEGVFDLDFEGGEMVSCNELMGSYSDFSDSIRASCEVSLANLGWDVRKGHRFFCAKVVHATDYRKTSKFGIMGKRLFNLDIAGVTAQDARGIAEELKEKTWE